MTARCAGSCSGCVLRRWPCSSCDRRRPDWHVLAAGRVVAPTSNSRPPRRSMSRAPPTHLGEAVRIRTDQPPGGRGQRSARMGPPARLAAVDLSGGARGDDAHRGRRTTRSSIPGGARIPRCRPIILMAHQDVVPVTPGTEGDWKHPPFDGVVADGAVWGRGAIDDKGSLVGDLRRPSRRWPRAASCRAAR